MVSTPDDGSCGVGTYAGDLRHYLSPEVTHIQLKTNCHNPVHFAAVAIQAGRVDVDIIHIQHEYGLFGKATVMWWIFAPIVWVLSMLYGTHIVITLHEAWDSETPNKSLLRLKRLYVKAVNTSIALIGTRLVFLSTACKCAYLQATPITVQEYEQMPHGVNVQGTQEIDMATAKSRFGYNPRDDVIVQPGYVSSQKGADIFIQLAMRIPEVEFLLAGGARNPEDTEYIKELRRRASSNVTITGQLDDESFHAAFCAADIVTLPYRKDGQSGVFNWCAAYGVPVIGSRCEYFQEVAQEWDCPALVDITELDDIETTVRAVLNSAERKDRLSKAIRLFRQANRYEAVGKQHEKLYRELRLKT